MKRAISCLIGLILALVPGALQAQGTYPGDFPPGYVFGNSSGSSGLAAPVAPATARGPNVLNIDQTHTTGDANVTIASTTRTEATSATLTLPRTWTLPAANSVNAGQHLVISDTAGAINGANKITISRAGADTINGATTFSMGVQFQIVDLISDGVSKWTTNASATGTVTGPGTTVVDHVATWNSTTGNLLKDSGLTLTPSTGTLTISNLKTFSVANSISISGTDTTAFTFPTSSDTVVGTNATQTLINKTLTSPTINGGTATALTSFGIRSTGTGVFDLTLANTENLTAGRTLTITVNDAARTLNLGGNLTTAGAFTTSGANALTLTTTGSTNVTLPTTGTLVNTAVTALSNLVTVGNITTGTWSATPVGLSFGGTGQTTAAAARAASALNIDEVTTFGNVNYTASVTDRTIATSVTFTAQRTITLPAVASYNAGQQLVIVDSFGAINGANTLIIAAGAGDTINGLASITISTQFGGAVLWPIGSNKWGFIAASGGGGGGTVTQINAGAGLSTGAVGGITTSGTLYNIPMPQGRLTLTTGKPVMTADATAQGTIFYDCYNGGKVVPFFNGNADQSEAIPGCEVSTVMVSAASAGQVVSGQVYDIWYVQSGANRICLAMSSAVGGGGGWASDTAGSNTARGTGYSQLDLTTRPYITNKNTITNCFNGSINYGPVSANQATYLGTMTATANGQTAMMFKPAAAAGGSNNFLGLYNGYNRVPVTSHARDSNASWNPPANTWRASDGSTSNRITFVDGLQQSFISGTFFDQGAPTAGTTPVVQLGMNLDSTSATPNAIAVNNVVGSGPTSTAVEGFPPQIGLHFIQAVENCTGTTPSCTFSGSGTFMGLSVRLEM